MQQLKERFKQNMQVKTKFGECKDDKGKRSEVRNQSRYVIGRVKICSMWML